jgi:hypothetical protein
MLDVRFSASACPVASAQYRSEGGMTAVENTVSRTKCISQSGIRIRTSGSNEQAERMGEEP